MAPSTRFVQVSHEEIEKLLWNLPPQTRAAMLMMSIVELDENDPLAAALGLVRASKLLAKGLNTTQRFRVADDMRNVADSLEHCRNELGATAP
jgi:hypothetical protein